MTLHCSGCQVRQNSLYAAGAALLVVGGIGIASSRQHSTEIKSWSNQLVIAIGKKNAAEQQAATLGEQLAQALTKNGEIKVTCNRLNTDIERQMARIASLEVDKAEMLRSNRTMATQVANSRQVCRQLGTQIASASHQITQMGSQLASERILSARQIADARTSSAATERQLASIRSQLDDQNKELSKLRRPAEALASADSGKNAMHAAGYTATPSVEPFYSPSGSTGVKGSARFVISIGKDCRVANIRLIESSGNADSDAVFQERLQQSLWRNAQGENPEEAQVEVTVTGGEPLSVRSI